MGSGCGYCSCSAEAWPNCSGQHRSSMYLSHISHATCRGGHQVGRYRSLGCDGGHCFKLFTRLRSSPPYLCLKQSRAAPHAAASTAPAINPAFITTASPLRTTAIMTAFLETTVSLYHALPGKLASNPHAGLKWYMRMVQGKRLVVVIVGRSKPSCRQRRRRRRLPLRQLVLQTSAMFVITFATTLTTSDYSCCCHCRCQDLDHDRFDAN